MKILYVVDFSNWVYKFKYIFPNLTSVYCGVEYHTGVLHGFNQAIRSLSRSPLSFDRVVVCLDGYPQRSYELLPQYKRQRVHETTDTVWVSKKEVIQFLTQLGQVYGIPVSVVASYGQEADQVIASVTHLALGRVDFLDRVQVTERSANEDSYLSSYGFQATPFELGSGYDSVVIGSSDSDIYQLKGLGNVFMDSSQSGIRVDYSDFTPKAVHNLPPNLIPIYKAFVGDVSDNVPSLVQRRSSPKVVSAILELGDVDPDRWMSCFVDDLKQGRVSSSPSLQSYLVGSERELWNNYKIVRLKFETSPELVSFPEYDVQSTFSKYSLKS